MSRASHTPGPWTASECYVQKANGETIANVWSGSVGLPEIKANTRLIAAAPDLLAAAKEVIRLIDDFVVPPGQSDLFLDLRRIDRHLSEAIAKAENEVAK